MELLTKNFAQLKSEVQKHIDADQVIQGTYWDSQDNKGCFIGCLAHSDQAKYLETEYGIPLMLTKISEEIFERLPEGKHVTFFGAFPDAVATDNKDLSLVSWKFLKALLEELLVQTPEVKTVIEGINKLAEGGSWDKDAATKAARNASSRNAARAAQAAAWAAAEVADASVAAASMSAAEADASMAAASMSAAEAAAFAVSAEQQSQILLQLIKEAPVTQLEDN